MDAPHLMLQNPPNTMLVYSFGTHFRMKQQCLRLIRVYTRVSALGDPALDHIHTFNHWFTAVQHITY